MNKWYMLIGSDKELSAKAVTMAKVTGSIGSTEEVRDEKGNVLKSATVRREGYQDSNYVLI
jgi:hypothetical protein